MLSVEEVTMAYRLILGREPEDPAVVEHHARTASSLAALRETLIVSDEFESARIPRLSSALDLGSPLRVDVYVPAPELEKMFARVQQTWAKLAVNHPDEAGRQDLDRMTRWLERNGLTGLGPTHSCCEYGRGRGQVSQWLASRFSRVIAWDVSRAQLNSREPVDLFFSIMALQHNPPPVIAFVLERMLHALKRGGIAFFQVPTYQPGYEFDAKKYLEQPPTGEMELHLLPQKCVFAIAEEAGCRVLEVQPDSYLGQPRFISNTFLLEKIRVKYV